MRAKTKSLPDPIQRFFSVQEYKYYLRDVYKFTVPAVKKKMAGTRKKKLKNVFLLLGLDFARMPTYI